MEKSAQAAAASPPKSTKKSTFAVVDSQAGGLAQDVKADATIGKAGEEEGVSKGSGIPNVPEIEDVDENYDDERRRRRRKRQSHVDTLAGAAQAGGSDGKEGEASSCRGKKPCFTSGLHQKGTTCN